MQSDEQHESDEKNNQRDEEVVVGKNGTRELGRIHRSRDGSPYRRRPSYVKKSVRQYRVATADALKASAAPQELLQ